MGFYSIFFCGFLWFPIGFPKPILGMVAKSIYNLEK
jgi:hypothetical protein